MLLVIDVQKGFLGPHTKHIPRLAEIEQRRHGLVVATRLLNPPNSPFRRFLDWHVMTDGEPEYDLAFIPGPDSIVIDKSRYSAVDDTLLRILSARGIGAVHLCGLKTDACLLKTALDLFEVGVAPIVLARLCATTAGPEAHAAALVLLARQIGPRCIIH